MDKAKRKLIADALAHIVEKACYGGPMLKIALMACGSELGREEILDGGRLAQAEHPFLRVVAVGRRVPGYDDLEWHETPDCETDIFFSLEKLLNEGGVAGAVAMHFPFPVGVATIGRIMTPGRGRPMFIASCTGTAAPSRPEALLRNAVYGIATAKACGIPKPTVAFLNLEGASSVLRALTRMRDKGYAVELGSSSRKDGGSLLRGNDIVSGAVDVLVCDTLTGNALVKIFSTYSSGGQYESIGWGYGPSVGEGWKKIVSIVSRASGAPVVANALALTARVAAGKLAAQVADELRAARDAGFADALEEFKPKSIGAETTGQPPVVPVDAEIYGVDVLDMENAMHTLWREGLYAETAMGCTGPVVRVQTAVKDKAIAILEHEGFI